MNTKERQETIGQAIAATDEVLACIEPIRQSSAEFAREQLANLVASLAEMRKAGAELDEQHLGVCYARALSVAERVRDGEVARYKLIMLLLPLNLARDRLIALRDGATVG